MAYICMSAQNAARPAHGEQPACSPWTVMRGRPPPSVRISRAATFQWTIAVKLSTSCSATYLLLTAVRRPPLLRCGSGSRLRQPAAEEGGLPLIPERRGHVHLLRPGGDSCFLEHDGKAPLLG